MDVSRRNSLAALALAPVLAPEMTAAKEAVSIRLIALDVGGTLIQDHGEVPAAMTLAMAQQGVTVSQAEISEWRGASKRAMIGHFLDTHRVAGDRKRLIGIIYADFNARADKAYRNVAPIEGAEDALKWMKDRGYLLATTTGFGRDLNAAIFRRLGWQQYFVASITSDDVSEGRPAPFMLFHAMEAARVENVRHTIAVGDTPLDLQAANNGGLLAAIGVTSGAATQARLRQEPNAAILPSVAHLPEFLQRSFPSKT